MIGVPKDAPRLIHELYFDSQENREKFVLSWHERMKSTIAWYRGMVSIKLHTQDDRELSLFIISEWGSAAAREKAHRCRDKIFLETILQIPNTAPRAR